MVAGESHPYAAAFVYFLLPATVSFLAVDYVDRYASLGVSIQIAGALRFLGILMVLTGGLWAAFERHLTRIMGFGAIFEIGMALLALSLAAGRTEITPVQGIYFAQFLPRALGLAIWALALCILSDETRDLTFDAVTGIAHKMPIVGALAILTIIGASGLIIAGLRTLGALVIDPETQKWQLTEKKSQIILLISGWVMLLMVGVLAQLSIPALTNMALIFISTPP
jgi:formate hydrogenlyase subunit 3/multisubunit Na+/H+ antiporter MnhD subunit